MSNYKKELLSINDFNHICRTCGNEGELKPLFDNLETLNLLESLTQIQFNSNEDLPDKICLNCLMKINEFCNFINNCKIIDDTLKKCVNEKLKQQELKLNELESSIEINEDDLIIPEDIIKIDEETSTEDITENQTDFGLLEWNATPEESQENKQFQFSTDNSVNEQDLIELEAFRKIQALNRVRKSWSRQHVPQNDPTEYKRKIQAFNQSNEATKAIEFHQGTTKEEIHRTRAKLTLPHEEHAAIMRRNFETPERIALRRALAREQMRKYRSKLTAEETTENRAQTIESMRKFRAKLNNYQMEMQKKQARDYFRQNRIDSSEEFVQKQKNRAFLLESLPPKLQVPLRLSEMVQTILKPNSDESTKFSLRPTKIPQVKKSCYETDVKMIENKPVMKFQTWKRQSEIPEIVTKQLMRNTLQMKRFYSSRKESKMIDESKGSCVKTAGFSQPCRSMLRKNNTIPVPTLQSSKM